MSGQITAFATVEQYAILTNRVDLALKNLTSGYPSTVGVVAERYYTLF